MNFEIYWRLETEDWKHYIVAMDSLSSSKTQSWLPWFLKGILITAFLVLFAKMFEVSIIKGSYYRKLSEENRIRHVVLPAPRGKIMAENGVVLIGNEESKKPNVVIDYKRKYNLGDKFAHAGGYLAEVSDKEIDKVDPNCPEKGVRSSGSLIGKSGLEESYDCSLLGINGEELIEVDTFGKKIRSLGRREPVPGSDLKTTINSDLQTEVARLMEGKNGGAIVTDTNGGVLAFYSSPSFDPNLLVSRSDNKQITELFNNPNLPLFNRVTGGTFHPGSVFKPLVALAALESNSIDKNYTYDDQGVINVNGFAYSNWYFTEYGRVEGQVDLTRALARSTDTFFYKVGELTGPDVIYDWAKKFGLAGVTGIDIPGEKSGLIPTPKWKKETKKENWFLGNTYHMAIGQGDVSLTPIEVNTYISAIANGGVLCPPHFVTSESGNDKLQMTNSKCRNLGIKTNNLDLVKEGMLGVCSEGGTGYTFFDFANKHGGIKVACKTGTAEVGATGTPHAWFTFFAPAESPQIVATVLVEGGGQGSQVAGPIARSIADYYFQALGNSR